MNSIPWRVQLGIVAAGYAAVLLLSAVLLYSRHLQYVHNAADAAAAGGMWAGGDLILAVFIGCLFCIPTFLLVLVVRQSEVESMRYGQVMLGLSFTMPIFLLVLRVTGQGNSFLGWFSFYRVMSSPLVIIGLVVSVLLARFPRARRLILYALVVEAGTLMVSVAIFFLTTLRH